MQELRNKRVYLGLSGGVDSAVALHLLLEQGALVTAVFIQGWYPPGLSCTWAQERLDAMRVAAHAGVAFRTLDASAAYRKEVIDYLLAEYRAGRTPNPDIMCNKAVKFGVFYEYARAAGADYVAMGHYARIEYGVDTAVLLRGSDLAKDQSYFLWAVDGRVLQHTLFPLGAFEKSAVRVLAQKYRVPVAEKKDSQGICFLGTVSVDDFLRSEFGVHPGTAVDIDGNEVGRHAGVLLSTLGSRVALHSAAAGPWYVIQKDVESNMLVVSPTRMPVGAHSAICAAKANWFETPLSQKLYTAQTRYHGELLTGTLEATDARITFAPQGALSEPAAAGQSLVLYDGMRCVGGGIIAPCAPQ